MDRRDANKEASEGGDTTRSIDDLLAEMEAAKMRTMELAGLLEMTRDSVGGKISGLNQRVMLDTRLLLVVIEALIRSKILDGSAVAAAFSKTVDRLGPIFDDAARVHAKHLAEQICVMRPDTASGETARGPILVVDNKPNAEGQQD